MESEIIEEVFVNDNNELILKIAGNGDASYQHVYREAAGVYWDESQKAFKSTPMNEWTISKWFLHIKDIVKSGLNVELKIDTNIDWESIPNEEKVKIQNALQHSV